MELRKGTYATALDEFFVRSHNSALYSHDPSCANSFRKRVE